MTSDISPDSDQPAVKRSRRKSRKVSLILLGVAILTETLAVSRKGYGVGGNVVVRCRKGHLFTTIWIPAASIKSLRLGWARVQRCPVGHHWSLVTPVRESDLNEDDLEFAEQHRDVRVP
jgi:hypothetical protein